MIDISILHELERIIESRKNNSSEKSYTAQLFQGGIIKTGKKVVEEAGEVVLAAALQNKEELTGEIADLIYHLSVLMCQKEVLWSDIAEMLQKRLNISGLEEKAARKAK